jgi:integrating conjugative element protein (TIGR03749 family)
MSMTKNQPGWLALSAALAFMLPLAGVAQQVKDLNLNSVPPDLVQAQPAGAQGTTAVDLGEDMQASEAGATGQARPAVLAPAQRAALAARRKAGGPGEVRRVARPGGAGVERAVFQREPVRVQLSVGKERLITLPAPAGLNLPTDMDQVARIETIGSTMYVTPLVPFTPIRIVAELIDTGQLVPFDFVASAGEKLPELEVSVVDPQAGAAGAAGEEAKKDEAPSADMVQLTRHAARQLYAPRRLAWATPGVNQVAVATDPVPRLIRGLNADIVPLGQWKSGPLYVTAVRVTNRSTMPVELALEQLRGRWVAATAQHGRIGAAGSDTDTTAVYLVCDRSFESCLQ